MVRWIAASLDARSPGRRALGPAMDDQRGGRRAGEPAAAAIPAGMRCLTRREREVLDSISGGHTNKEGALRLKIGPRTFESHRARIMRKLAARNAAELLRKVLAETP
jgi:DNA-binding CsgD family transcriptional regulator